MIYTIIACKHLNENFIDISLHFFDAVVGVISNDISLKSVTFSNLLLFSPTKSISQQRLGPCRTLRTIITAFSAAGIRNAQPTNGLF